MAAVDKTYLKKIIDDDHAQRYPALKSDEHFEIFCAEQILKKYELDDVEVKSGLVDGGNDGGIDAIYCFANRQLVCEDTTFPKRQENVNIDLIIVTARGGAGSFNTEVVGKLRTTIDNLLDPSVSLKNAKKLYNARLLDTADRFRRLYLSLRKHHPNLAIILNYACMGEEISAHVDDLKGKLVTRLKELYTPVNCDLRLIGAKDLLALYDQSPPTTLELSTLKLLAVGKDAYVAIVKLQDFFAFLTDAEKELLRRIFESNVRDYQGNVKVNQDIRETLATGSESGEEFWWLNNGITIIASDVRGHGETLLIDDPQIVNGLQTSREIHQFFKSQETTTETRSVLVRVIKTQDSATRDRIIKATNSQTSIPSPWLHATEEVHRRIEQYFKGHDLYYDRRKNYYKNQRVPAQKVATIPWLGQAIMAIALARPGDARARPSTVLQKDYRRVFNKAYNPETYLMCARVMKRVEAFLDSKHIAATTQNNIKFHVAMFVAAKAAGGIVTSSEAIQKLDINKLNDSLMDDSYRRVYKTYRKLGATDQVAKGPSFVAKLVKDLGSI